MAHQIPSKMRQVYVLHSEAGVHMLASNFKAIYMALADLKINIVHAHLKSYSWYTFYLANNKDVAIPKKDGGHYTISRRPILSKYFGHLQREKIIIPSFKNPASKP